ncbi:swi5-dependent recombination DNA repair protein 1 homolog isoform X1 [Rattus rattus]|uniref:swi5-dependent recombination DNA repair protein 1 homolog isoform X1 n=2 Tax=Rattus rattus TaxID=10117 RepID=UPI0013F34513|nr:swi5-dependent recombination DNA repair protein 1 homolog isoform X1 [Rattus rattus]
MAEEEGNQEITSKMENPSDSASTSPDIPQTSENPPSPPTSPDKPQTSENPPSLHSNSSGKQPMSGTLKERLKKARASSQPFCSVVKRIKVENEENDQTLSEPGESSKEENCSKAQESLENKDNEPEKESSEDKNTSESKSLDTGSSSVLQKDSTEKTIGLLKEEKAKLTRQVQEKEDLLRRLKLVKMYRIKNDVTELEDLIKKWRRCGQRLLCELQSIMSEDEDEKLTLTELIDHYGIDDKLLHYNRSEEEFTGV